VLAGAAVVVLDFVANWLLKKLASAARKVGAKLKGLAEKFKAKRKAGKHHDEHDAKKHQEHDERNKRNDHDDKSADAKKDEEEKKKKLAIAVRALRPEIKSFLKTQPSKTDVRGRLAGWKSQHQLTDLRMNELGDRVTFTAKVNPEQNVGIKAIEPKPGTAAYFQAKQEAQDRAKALVEASESTTSLRERHGRSKESGQPLELLTAKQQVAFAGVLAQGGTGGTVVRVGAGDSAGNVSIRQFGNKNSIIVNHHGSSQAILQKLTQGAKDVGITEAELAAEIANFARTGQIDRRIRANPQLMHTIRAEVVRQHSVEPARISTHLTDRAIASERASGSGGTIASLETPADIAAIKGQSSGAVQGHQVVEDAIERQSKGLPPVDPRTKAERVRETSGHRVLEAIDKEAQAMDGKLLLDISTLSNAMLQRIRRELGL
jgi:hypothetical protein